MKKKEIKFELHPTNIKLWIGVVILLPTMFAAFSKIKDSIKYDVLGKPKNNEERLVNHMAKAHLFANDTPTLDKKIELSGNREINVKAYSDECVVTSKKDSTGKIVGFKILADSKLIDSLSINKRLLPEAYAGMQPFSFGVHANDDVYLESFGKRRGQVLRVYKDGCILTYMMDKYGNTHTWRWKEYNHSRRNN